MFNRVWYWVAESVVVIVDVIICFYGGVMLSVVDLHYGDVVLEWVLESFPREWVCDLS